MDSEAELQRPGDLPAPLRVGVGRVCIQKTPVRTLAYPYNEDKREGWNSLTRLDYVVSPSQLLTVKLHAAPQRLMYYGLGFYNPQPVTPNYWGHEGMADLSHKITIAGGMLETAMSVAQVSARVAGQGDAELVMTPTGNAGNYFMRQDRRARKFELLANWTPRPVGRNRQASPESRPLRRGGSCARRLSRAANLDRRHGGRSCSNAFNLRTATGTGQPIWRRACTLTITGY